MTVLGMSIFLMAALGLAIDGSHLYVQRQLAQAAADAAAQAAMMSVFVGTNTSGSHAFSVGTPASPFNYTCTSSDAATPCYYAQSLNGFNTASDSVKYTASPSGLTIPALSPTYPVNLLQVTVSRNVPATLMALLGWSTFPVSASAVAAIVYVDSPVPIIVTHPTLSGSLNLGGSGSTSKITVCGGPSQSIQVNSSSATAVTWNGNPVIDLSHAGPADPGNCTTGTGADFGITGGPPGANTIFGCTSGQFSGCTNLGSTGFFIDPSPMILDPLAGVVAPPDPTVANSLDLNPPNGTLAPGVNGCPATASSNCVVYFPGKYTNRIDVKGQTAVFTPGIYWMYGVDFTLDSNGDPFMATGYTDSSTTGVPTISPTVNCCGTGTNWTQNMLIYMTGPATAGKNATGTFSVNANAGKQYTTAPISTMIGAPNASSYKGILLFIDRNAAANFNHSIDGGATLQLTGTLYLNSNFNDGTTYQKLNLQGSGGGTTKLTGEIITSTMDLQGTPGIVMNLNSTASYKLNKVALVQ